MTVGETAGTVRRAGFRLLRAWWFEVRQLTGSRIYLFTVIVLPLIFASIAHFMFHGSPRGQGPLVIALSAGLMGMWSATVTGSGSAINRLRHMQVLELLVASPAASFLTVLPFSLATASLGLYSLVATLLCSALFFGMQPHIASPAEFLIALPVTTLSLGLLGFLLASLFVLYPAAQSLANLLEYPVWMLSGILVPVTALPEPLRYVSYALAPTWGVKALTGAATGASGVLPGAALCLALALLYGVLTYFLMRRFEWLARSAGTLSLR
ncbi:ABC transporter permease [Streptomyces sp. NPDC005865]|uniref:ABC transporter permease n=1 Tax=Streptomyces sp. NPDC005865 TaxID=3155453 RepID=UPI0033D311C1